MRLIANGNDVVKISIIANNDRYFFNLIYKNSTILKYMIKNVVFQEGIHSFYGVLKIKVIYGTITIFGATVGKGFSETIYSPFHQLAIPIQSDKRFCIQFTEIQENELHPNEIPFYSPCPDGYTQIIPFVFHSYGNKGAKYPNSLIKKINNILLSKKPANILLYGGKGIGKSTLSNFLVNMLKSFPANPEMNENNNEEEEVIDTNKEETKEDNNEDKPKYYHFLNDDDVNESSNDDDDDENSLYQRKVAFVDFDPGQPEISLPTLVSFTKDCPFLFGSSEHHSQFADECYTISTVNISQATSNFLFSTNLFGRIFGQNKQNSAKDPQFTVINSHGWVENDGFRLQMAIIKSMNPDLVICLYKSSNPPPKSFTNNQFNVKIKPIREVCHLEPMGLRNIRFERYFMMQKNKNSSPSFIYRPISSIIPISFPIKRFRYAFPFETNILRCFSQIPRVLNCSLVTFCIDNSKYNENEEKKLLFSLVNPKSMKCCGIGFVRAIDVQSQTLYIITPENVETLQQANTIMYITSNIPNSFLRDSCRFYLPYNNLMIKPHLSSNK